MDAPSLTRIARGLADRGLCAEAVDALHRAIDTPTGQTSCAALLAITLLSAELDAALAATAAAAVSQFESPPRVVAPNQSPTDQDPSSTVSFSPCITKRSAAPFVRDIWRS